MLGVLHKMSRVVIITVAGISSRFNKGIDEDNKVLKCLYTEGDEKATLLYHMLKKLSYADRIMIVGGYKYENLKLYVESVIPAKFKQKIKLVCNEHFRDFSSGYSLYLGLCEALNNTDGVTDVLFIEGDLDTDEDSLGTVIKSNSSVLTYNYEPIKANKAVVLYEDETGRYKYAFNSSHGLLSIYSPFSAIYNSGQIWKFTDLEALKVANDLFIKEQKDGTNLVIIQEYLNRLQSDKVTILPLKYWTNCNTREDYRNIKERWDNENT